MSDRASKSDIQPIANAHIMNVQQLLQPWQNIHVAVTHACADCVFLPGQWGKKKNQA